MSTYPHFVHFQQAKCAAIKELFLKIYNIAKVSGDVNIYVDSQVEFSSS